MIILPELRWRAVLFLFEDTIEVTEVVKPTGIADLSNTLGSVHQHPTGIAQPKVNDILTEIPACMQLEETAERRRAHPGNPRHR